MTAWNEIVDLVQKAQTGDRAAYGELVARFEPAVYAVALAQLRNPAEAQELTQEVFIHAHDQAGSAPRGQLLRRLAAANNGAHGAQPPDPARPASRARTRRCCRTRPPRSQSPLDDLVRAEQHAELYRGLERLKAIDRATLMAFYIHGRSLKQMSREFETPVGTIKRRLHVARNRLRRQLQAEPAEDELACA